MNGEKITLIIGQQYIQCAIFMISLSKTRKNRDILKIVC